MNKCRVMKLLNLVTPRSVTFEVTCGHDEETFKVIDSSKCNIRLGI